MTTTTYSPALFDVADEAAARRIILTPEGRSTEARWETETPALASLAGAVLRLGPDSRVLDYGCGIGRLPRALIERFGCRVTGVDISARMRALAPDYVRSDRFEVITPAALFDWGEGAFDAALAIWVLQHCHKPEADSGLIRRALKTGGRLLVVNNFHRAVPVVEKTWANDGFDVAAHLAATFTELERGDLPASMLGETLARLTFWGVYEAPGPQETDT